MSMTMVSVNWHIYLISGVNHRAKKTRLHPLLTRNIIIEIKRSHALSDTSDTLTIYDGCYFDKIIINTVELPFIVFLNQW